MMLTQAIVRELLDYNPFTGVLTWKRQHRRWFKTQRDCKCVEYTICWQARNKPPWCTPHIREIRL